MKLKPTQLQLTTPAEEFEMNTEKTGGKCRISHSGKAEAKGRLEYRNIPWEPSQWEKVGTNGSLEGDTFVG